MLSIALFCFVIPGFFPFTIPWIRERMSRARRDFLLVSRDVWIVKGESRIRARREGECPDKMVRVLGNKRAMHL